MMWYYALVVFVNQLIFIGCRTWNVKSIAKQNLFQALLSGTFVHLSWIISIFIGVDTVDIIIKSQDWAYLIVIFFSLTGGLIGTYIGMLEKRNKNKKNDDQN